MSKSLKRVTKALADAGIDAQIVETSDQTRTAEQAAAQAGCVVDQIAKSIIFKGEDSNLAVLFITAGGNQVDAAKASTVAGEVLGKADAVLIRAQTGFAIGGVSPVGHLNPIRTFIDPRLTEFDVIWAAAGTPRHIFSLAPSDLIALTNGQLADFTG
ncbi:Cys-tRNA(Pro) deacylase, prolyl-tRNA editing enzyme YbaK/EbsC [Litoreibacter ascidiaceicola]|uniref:Cys-tRNA(Pro) deacylase, prolyl-tRNA editing enzyme YbaK/EbsC n=1 Tax=Litoreibacter ascidiaceicola TaxID=1486859 RepID=A0A1M4W0X2_9RHOB|nr:YbaK/EbsC family protein [Litoreibacter ascidiaceicola]SHE74866.1 Cys-tRNA(Pro) deacylase, prolyl-tRNA editing enzyme YbaK/EbsC [Litoreibacter ascidiaceicola]